MKIVQNQKDGSAEIRFSWKEVFVILRKRKLTFTAEGLRHFGNHLVKIVSEWNLWFNEDLKNKQTKCNEIKVDNK